MIKVENIEVMGWEPAIRGMRNPMNSWAKSDSGVRNFSIPEQGEVYPDEFVIGPNDHKLMMNLAHGGPVHAKYRRMIVAYMDITAPLYWWKEFDTYKVGTVANSCSTMHKIHAKEFTLDDFSHDHLTEESIACLKQVIALLNANRTWFIRDDLMDVTGHRKDYWWQMIQLLPSSYNQRRTVMLPYEVLANMHDSREFHKLDEWREFCKVIESLPYSELIIGEKVDEENV